MRRDMLAAARAGADAVELRLDYLQPLPSPEALRRLLAEAPLETIATCRPLRQGGRFAGKEADRLKILSQAADMGASFLDVEMDVPVADRPAGATILSHHDFDRCPADLDRIASQLKASGGSVGKIAFAAQGPEDALRALDILRAASKPTIALAMGEEGVLSRILARKFGAFGTFAALEGGAESAPGQPTLRQFKDLYGWDRIGPATEVYGVIGCPVAHSMSPAVHNGAFAAEGLAAVYVPVLIQPGAENFDRFMDSLRARPWLDWRGLSVTIPHKENALRYVGADRCEELARRIGAVNTITLGTDGALRGDNTDYAAALEALCAAMGIGREALAGRPVAVIGAGGAARAIVAGLAHAGAAVTVYNRTLARAEELAGEFGCSAAGFDAAARTGAEVLINCTPIGMWPHVDNCPLEAIPPAVRVVFDTIYNPLGTRLLQLAKDARCVAIPGLEMFVQQAVAQFQIWTGRNAPVSVMREVVRKRLERS